MSKPGKKTTLLDSLRSLINEARLSVAHPNSSPTISQHMLRGPFLKKIARVRGLRLHLIAKGLNFEIRDYLQNNPANGVEGATAVQLEMWPESLRNLIESIDRERVYVPSRKEFVRLVPDQITAKETQEAGDYLVIKGEETIRVGKLLIDLAAKINTLSRS